MWSRIRPKKMYLSIFLYSCVVVCLLTLVFTVFLSQRFAGSALDEMDKSNQEKMRQVVQSSEFTLQKLRQFALRVYSDESISMWINMKEEDYSPSSLNKAANSVREFASSEPFIHGIYLFNFNMGEIYTSESSVYTTDDFYDQSMLEYVKSQKTPYLQYVNHEVDGETYLALVAPASGPNQNYQGYVAILFSKPLLNENMLQISEADQNKIYIEGKNKEFILGNTDAAFANAFMNAEKPAADRSWKWSSGKETWSVQSQQLPIEGWNVFHLAPISAWQAKVTDIRIEIVGSSVILLFALLLFLFWQSYRSFKPISDLAVQIHKKLGKRHPEAQPASAGNEVAWIRSGFHALVEQLEQLDLSIKSSKALVKDDHLRQWILSSKASKPIEAFVREQTRILREGRFRMAVVRLESYGRFEEQYDFASRKLLRFALGNILAEALAEHGYNAETVDFGSDHIVALYPASSIEEERKREIAALEDARERISRWLTLEVRAAIGSLLTVEDNLQLEYTRLYELTLLAFIRRDNGVFTLEDLERYEGSKDGDLDEGLLKQIVHSVQLKNVKALEGYLDELSSRMQSLSYEECKLQLTHMIYSIMRSLKNRRTFQGMKSIRDFLDQFATLDEVMSWLHGELLQVIDQHGRKKASNRNDEVAAEMIEYVRNHLRNPMLSVDDVAAHVSMSVNYARQIFKDRFDGSLSDYIANQRIEYAIKLLTTTDWTVADITEQSGFQTKSTFFSAFKRATGMTPNQYRSDQSREKA